MRGNLEYALFSLYQVVLPAPAAHHPFYDAVGLRAVPVVVEPENNQVVFLDKFEFILDHSYVFAVAVPVAIVVVEGRFVGDYQVMSLPGRLLEYGLGGHEGRYDPRHLPAGITRLKRVDGFLHPFNVNGIPDLVDDISRRRVLGALSFQVNGENNQRKQQHQ